MAEGVPEPPSGVLLIDKPSGITSHDVVYRVRRALGVKKVGHAGTLDPLATGLLVLGVGRATRLLRFLGDMPKTYEGSGVLGVETNTLDAEGEVTREGPVDVTEPQLKEALDAFVGEIEQVPPAYSAVKIGGERLYKSARKGEDVEAPPRRVTVHRFDLVAFEPPRLDFVVQCSSGTYVRSLVADVGTALGTGAHLAALRRTVIGPFRVQDATSPDHPGPLLPLDRAVAHLPQFELHPEEAKVAVHGCCLGPTGIAGPYRAVAPDGRLIGIYQDDGAMAVPQVILAPA
ncbi:MAG TPA: tRNA pseudouridine(55) synthase TruB [Actinomycetota bacterium]|nr:tRNA pseudouridine(55) synthase TruB [Actinomycetota bacterium]